MRRTTWSAPRSRSRRTAGNGSRGRRAVDFEDPLPFWEWVLSLLLLVLLVAATLRALLDSTSAILAPRSSVRHQGSGRPGGDASSGDASLSRGRDAYDNRRTPLSGSGGPAQKRQKSSLERLSWSTMVMSGALPDTAGSVTPTKARRV